MSVSYTHLTDTLALSAGKLAATVANVGLITEFGLHDEVVGIGNLCRFHHLLHSCIFHTEGNVVEEGVIEQNGCLLYTSANQRILRSVEDSQTATALHQLLSFGEAFRTVGHHATIIPVNLSLIHIS